MQVNWLDHVNIIAADLHGTARFYADLLDLTIRDAPRTKCNNRRRPK